MSTRHSPLAPIHTHHSPLPYLLLVAAPLVPSFYFIKDDTTIDHWRPIERRIFGFSLKAPIQSILYSSPFVMRKFRSAHLQSNHWPNSQKVLFPLLIEMASNNLLLLSFVTFIIAVSVAKKEEESAAEFEGQKLSWKEDDGLEIKIIRPIAREKCTVRSQAGDTVEQYYRLSDADGNEIGSNFGKKPYVFTLGSRQVIDGMDRAMTGMCVGEKRKVVIPGDLGFGNDGRERDGIKSGQVLYYTVQLKNLSRPVPGAKWREEGGLEIEVTHKIESEKCRRSAPGDTIHQHYTLHLKDGTFIDSSYSRNSPFIFRLHHNEVIPGMDRAMTAMCEGEKRKVIIPASLGYGDKGRDNIPGGAELHFDIELFKLIKPSDEL